MIFIVCFIGVGLLGRGLGKPLRDWAGKWQSDSLEFWRIAGLASFVIGIITGGHLDYIFAYLLLSVASWVGFISFGELRRRGGLDKELRGKNEMLRSMDERLKHLGPQGQQPPAAKRASRGGVSMDTSSASAEPVSRWPKEHEAAGAELPEIVVDRDSGSIDLSGLIAEATATAGVTEYLPAEDEHVMADETGAEESSVAEPHDAQEADASRAQEEDATDAAPTEAETKAVIEEETRPVHAEPAQPAGYNSGPVKLGSNVGSLFSGKETPLAQRSSGPLTSLGGAIPHYELDLRSKRKAPVKARPTEE